VVEVYVDACHKLIMMQGSPFKWSVGSGRLMKISTQHLIDDGRVDK
jgi:hypothetical protein